ncbi:hypothetical protein LCGC14_1012420 [marine sediment metagenome]|uniref:Uncharacterized protein n=1 Tax=marine sediment metagenome TaxID=412755 RepID=A0A0F9QI65_9ZZZZ
MPNLELTVAELRALHAAGMQGIFAGPRVRNELEPWALAFRRAWRKIVNAIELVDALAELTRTLARAGNNDEQIGENLNPLPMPPLGRGDD